MAGTAVRDMLVTEFGIRIAYFHDAPDAHLALIGVDRALLPGRDAWQREFEQDAARPVRARRLYALAWELDGRVVGFSTADRIDAGAQAWMHLHIVDPALRGAGLGSRFVRLSAVRYLDVLGLRRLYAEPNAFNVAANRTLQRAGFRYVLTHETTPGPLNPPQATTRWVLEAP